MLSIKRIFAWICRFLITGIIIELISGSIYVAFQNDRRIYQPWKTTCYVINNMLIQYTCKTCNKYSCDDYDCYDETLVIIYEISNGTMITNTINNTGITVLMKVGENRTCYYDGKNDVLSVKWDYRNTDGFFLSVFL